MSQQNKQQFCVSWKMSHYLSGLPCEEGENPQLARLHLIAILWPQEPY